jgi:putative transposase
MGKKIGHGAEEIIRKLRQADVLLSQGKRVAEICREIGVSDATYYKWRKAFGGMGVEQARRLKELERENDRLKKAVAELTLDKPILKEAATGNV